MELGAISRGPALYAIAAGASFLLSAAAFPFYIGWLKNKHIQQYIREEGPESHAKKAKTPTMGGLCFILVTLVVGVVSLALAAPQGSLIAGIALAVAACCGFVGFADDMSKVKGKSNKGLSARSRLLMEFGLGFLLAVILIALKVPVQNLLVGIAPADGGAFAAEFWAIPEAVAPVYILFITPFLVAATTNAVNLHDGMDGLAGGTSLQVLLVLAFFLAVAGHTALALVAVVAAAAILGFLLYNRYPAKVFMGDTGSLFIGGLVAVLVAIGGLTLLFVPLAFIYIAETLSVIAQVAYFKLTKEYVPERPMSSLSLAIYKLRHKLPGEGKRLFRMAPLHHHFEAVAAERGQKEWQVVAAFWAVQLLLCAAVVAVVVLP